MARKYISAVATTSFVETPLPHIASNEVYLIFIYYRCLFSNYLIKKKCKQISKLLVIALLKFTLGSLALFSSKVEKNN